MIYVIGLILFALLFYGFALCCVKLPPFIQNRRYIQMELERAESEHEYRHWKREMRRLWADAMPFLRMFMK